MLIVLKIATRPTSPKQPCYGSGKQKSVLIDTLSLFRLRDADPEIHARGTILGGRHAGEPRLDRLPTTQSIFSCAEIYRASGHSASLISVVAGHFVPTSHSKQPTTSETMEINIRKANLDDLKHILHHRRAMFEEMGFRDAAVLNQMEESSRMYFSEALRTGSYKAWLAEAPNGRIVAGGGIVIADWPGYPGENHAKRAWILNMYTAPEARRHGVAKQILEIMLDWCRSEGFSAVSLHASSTGRPLYEAAGFQSTNEMRLTLG
jgi:GNAT superfamily N-acetyltransferase